MNTAPNTEQIVSLLEKSAGPDREIDRLITIDLGYTRKVAYREASDGRVLRRVYWVVPGNELVVVMPFFTSSLADAKRLAMTVAPGRAYAVSWNKGEGAAVIEGERPCVAATPALALCLAAMRYKHKGLDEFNFSYLNKPTLPIPQE